MANSTSRVPWYHIYDFSSFYFKRMFEVIREFFYNIYNYFFPSQDEFAFVTELRPLNKITLSPSPPLRPPVFSPCSPSFPPNPFHFKRKLPYPQFAPKKKRKYIDYIALSKRE